MHCLSKYIHELTACSYGWITVMCHVSYVIKKLRSWHCGTKLHAAHAKEIIWVSSEETFDCWDRRFKSLWGHGYSSCVFVVCCACSGLCDELITRSEESYRVCMFVCILEISTTWRPKTNLGCRATEGGERREEEEEEVSKLRFSKYIFCMKDYHHHHHSRRRRHHHHHHYHQQQQNHKSVIRQSFYKSLVAYILSSFVSTHHNSKICSNRNLATSTNYELLNCLITNLTIFN